MKQFAGVCMMVVGLLTVGMAWGAGEPAAGNGGNPSVPKGGFDLGPTIRQATQTTFMGRAPTQAELDAARGAMALLEARKAETIAYIISALQGPEPDFSARVHTEHYAVVLWRLGPEAIKALEPIVQSKEARVRRHGAYILGAGGKGDEVASAMLEKLIAVEKDPQVLAQAIGSLGGSGTAPSPEIMAKCLGLEDPVVRVAAIQVYWHKASDEGRKALEPLLKTETNRSVCFWLGYTLARQPGFAAKSLLEHPQPGVRDGALEELRNKTELTGPKETDLVAAQAEKETDTLLVLSIGRFLGARGDPRCLPALIAVLEAKDDPRQEYHGSSAKTAAHSLLGNLTGRAFHLTDADRAAGRAGGDRYGSSAKAYRQWWSEHRDHIRWNRERNQFVVGPNAP